MKTRHDGWTKEEDSLLAKVVICQIRDGGSQRQAFEEAGKSLSRTAAACSYRWYSNVRKKYSKEIYMVMKRRKEMISTPADKSTYKQKAEWSEDKSAKGAAVEYQTLEGLIEPLFNKAFEYVIQSPEFKQAEEKINTLNLQLHRLAGENETILKEKNRIEEEYCGLKEIIDSARTLLHPMEAPKASSQKNNSATLWSLKR